MTIEEITKEAWLILLELKGTNDYEFPFRIPQLIERAATLVKEMEKHGSAQGT